MQDARPAPRRSTRSGARCPRRGPPASTPTRSAPEPDERREHPDRVRAAPDAGEHVVGVAAVLGLAELHAGLVADHPLQVPHQAGERVGSDDRADHVVGVPDARRPVAQRLVDGVLEGARPARDDHRPRPRAAASGRRWGPGGCVSSSPMYTTHGSPNSAQAVAVATPCWPAPVSAMIRRLPEAPGEQDLPDRVVDLVGAGVGEVLALQVDPVPELLRQAGSRRSGRWGGRRSRGTAPSSSPAEAPGSSRELASTPGRARPGPG